MRACVPALLIVAAALALGCSRSSAAKQRARSEPPPPAPGSLLDAGAWASRLGSAEPAPASRKSIAPLAARSAVMSDEVQDNGEKVLAVRLVYRVSFVVPSIFRDRRALVRAAAGELHVDMSTDRLRARFIGPGWPIDEGAELRMRTDLLGGYLFDGEGGRTLGAGQLSGWFEGREQGVAQARVAVRREYAKRSVVDSDRAVPGPLLCALIAEWSNVPRRALDQRCEAGALPPGFTVGPWTGELTAVVPMELPRSALRADEAAPPGPIPARDARMLLEPEALALLAPAKPQPEPAPASLLVENRTDTRAIVIAQGVAVGWLDAGQQLRIDGFTPGYYRVGAIRPLGILRSPPRLLRVPGTFVIGGPSPDVEPEP